jgi:hypothetical protein
MAQVILFYALAAYKRARWARRNCTGDRGILVERGFHYLVQFSVVVPEASGRIESLI